MTVPSQPASLCKQTTLTSTPTPYEILSKYTVFPDAHQKAWWEKTGQLLNKVLISANYNTSRQFEALTFYTQVLIPHLGPYPFAFRSAITRSGLPLEFSVNYQQKGGAEPVVRIGYEPVSAESGTEKDLYNQLPVLDLLKRLEEVQIPGFDASLFHHFLEHHTLSATDKDSLTRNKMEGSNLTSQSAFGFDLRPQAVSVKGYTFPGFKCHASGRSFGKLFAESIQPIADRIGHFPSFDKVNEYLEETNGYSQVAFWSFDCVDPAKSRLKLYSSSNEVVWSKIEEIWTLGGRADTSTVKEGLKYLSQLWQLTKVEEGHRAFTGGFDDGKDSTPTPMVWNYEMKAGEEIPVTKFYFPIHGENDAKIVRGVAQYLSDIGLVEYGEGYEETVRDYFPDRDLEKTARLTSWISFAYTEKTGVYLSVYYHSSDDYPWTEEESSA
ncbi:putative tryptophan dimethylallyltransferase [Aspergillus brunneoviolaceus CBS 621.78]|uniref:Tryptophan dimethylallyltransferase n=1 Tax=Aspergillus brunneoviolaceus CBS 621.78 TaxID=1450534 RepID=A0ACD1GPF0_9EURO|nr:putative tryptophan dimethylallyltransferase [Aspergillus brunneoviolaceus CBS 621.78]RAH51240.1 putative tryptophan dimethylallyltransferase [Aspergillus brunneoviolaceus CBS 621.78]